ncbi:hypothetical protein FRC09_020650 [Ceratobasidium sp. 395]|nr:hypothetical protein FRC09_020650 [Ceratobasidium sp. 395]
MASGELLVTGNKIQAMADIIHPPPPPSQADPSKVSGTPSALAPLKADFDNAHRDETDQALRLQRGLLEARRRRREERFKITFESEARTMARSLGTLNREGPPVLVRTASGKSPPALEYYLVLKV